MKILLSTFLLIVGSLSLWSQYSIIVEGAEPTEEFYRNTRTYYAQDHQGFASLGDFLTSLPQVQKLGEAYLLRGQGESGFSSTGYFLNGRKLSVEELRSFDLDSIPWSLVERVEIVQGSLGHRWGDNTQAGGINIVTSEPQGIRLVVEQGVNLIPGNPNTDYNTLFEEGRLLSPSVTLQSGFAGLGSIFLHYNEDRSTRINDFKRVLSTRLTTEIGEIEVGGFYSYLESGLPGSIAQSVFEEDPDTAGTVQDLAKLHQAHVDLFYPLLPEVQTRYTSSFDFSQADFYGFFSFSDRSKWVQDIRVEGTLELLPLLQVGGHLDASLVYFMLNRYSAVEREVLSGEFSASRNLFGPGVWASYEIRPLQLDLGLAGNVYQLETWSPDEGSAGTDIQFQPTGSISLSWTEDLQEAYVSFSRGFRFPLLDEQVNYSGFGSPDFFTDLEPESSWELNLGYSYLGEIVEVDLGAYYLLTYDQIAYDSTLFRNANIGEVHRIGGTAESRLFLGDFKVELGYQFTLARQGEEKVADWLPSLDMPLVPNHKLTHSLSWSPLAEMDFNISGVLTGPFRDGSDFNNTLDLVPGSYQLDFRGHWDLFPEELALILSLENILNQRLPDLSYYSSFAIPPDYFYYPEKGTNLRVALDWQP